MQRQSDIVDDIQKIFAFNKTSKNLLEKINITECDEKIREEFKNYDQRINKMKSCLSIIMSYVGGNKIAVIDIMRNSVIGEYIDKVLMHINNKTKILETKMHKAVMDMLRMIMSDDIKIRDVSYGEYRDALEELMKELTIMIRILGNEDLFDQYDNESHTIIEEYKKLTDKLIPVIFRKRGMSVDIDDEKILKTVADFIKMAGKYTDINRIIEKNNIKKNKYAHIMEHVCKQCGNKSSTMINDILTCTDCGYIFTVMEEESSYKDISRVSMSTEYMYDAISTFTDIISRYQGNKHKPLNMSMLEDISKSLYEGGVINKQYKDIDFEDKKMRTDVFKNLTKRQLRKSFKEMRYSCYYNDVNYIHSYLTGIDADDISALEKTLIEEYRQLYKTYEVLYKDNNMIKGNFILYKLLRKHGHKCNQDDFQITRTQDKFNEYKRKYEEMCKHLGWTDI